MRGKAVLCVRYCDARPCGRGCLSARGGVSHKERKNRKPTVGTRHLGINIIIGPYALFLTDVRGRNK